MEEDRTDGGKRQGRTSGQMDIGVVVNRVDLELTVISCSNTHLELGRTSGDEDYLRLN